VIAEEKCGFAVANGDCAALVRAIRDLQSTAGLADTMGARGREALERAYSTRIGCSAWQQRIHGLSMARLV
jgi:glycosyltransferase involved in cell wall biosynthesis